MKYLLGFVAAVRAFLTKFLEADSCPIGWQPTPLSPVFYGFRDYHIRFPPTTEQPPLSARVGLTERGIPARVFFPSLDGSPQNAAILKYCGRYPLILFIHGECITDAEHYKKWHDLASLIARSGYVVLLPSFPYIQDVEDGDVVRISNLIAWMRSDWEHRETLMPAPATGIVGHSFGGGLVAEFAGANTGEIRAWAVLSGETRDGNFPAITSSLVPKLFVFGVGNGEAPAVDLTPVESSGLWSALPRPKHTAALSGIHHFDYLAPGTSTCQEGRGNCDLTPSLATEILLMFFGLYLHPEYATGLPPRIPWSLAAPRLDEIYLTPEQSFYAGSWLAGFSNLNSGSQCQLKLTWDVTPDPSGSGSISLP